MKYVFTKRQLKLNEESEIVVGNNSSGSKNLANLQGDLNSAMNSNPGKVKFGADSENYNQNTNDTNRKLDYTTTGKNAKEMTDKIKQDISKPGIIHDKYNQGDLEIHAIKLPNTSESVRFTKKELNEFLNSI